MALSAEGAGRPVPSDIRARNVFGGGLKYSLHLEGKETLSIAEHA